MKVIFCLHHFLPGIVGGTEVYTFNLAKQLLQHHIDVLIVIPNLGMDITEEYYFEEVRVIKYAENSVEDRAMIQGKTKPDGLKIFGEIIQKEKPTIVHFQELAPGRGINMFHVEKVYEFKIPLVITFHVPFYTCFKGSLLFKEDTKCDGEIIIKRCTACVFHQKGIRGARAVLLNKIAMGLYRLKIDGTNLNSKAGTALGVPFLVRKIEKNLMAFSNLAEKIIVVAEWYKEVLARNNVQAGKIAFIKQGLPTGEAFNIEGEETKLPIRLVYIGRITQLKGVQLLIDAVLQLTAASVILDIYGPESNDQFVMDCKQKTKDASNIRWKGRLTATEVNEVLPTYHLLCLPSAFEMSSLVIQEAFAARIPVLASDVYGNAEQIIDGENGWLFKYNDLEHLIYTLNQLINHPGLIESAKAKILQPNTFETVAKEHSEIYSAVIKNYRSL